jgi:sec-independent protein translocase protein TatC
LTEERMRFTEHLDELRARLKVVVYVLLVVLIVVVMFPANPIYQAQHLDQYMTLQFLEHTFMAALLQQIVSYVLPSSWGLIAATGLGEGMEVYFIGALLVSVAISMPVIAYETYKFIDPALKPEEKQLVYPFVTGTSVLFTVGVLFGYFVLAKFLVLALGPFIYSIGIKNPLIDAASFYYVTFLVIASTGAAFTAPVFIYSLIRLRVLDPDFFSRNRVIIWFVLWVITGLFLTPDGGPLLDLVLFFPIVGLVEGAVFLARRGVKKNKPPQVGKAPTSGELTCKNCGAKLSKGQIFCPNCGQAQG